MFTIDVFTIVVTCVVATHDGLLLRSWLGKTTVMALRALYTIGILRQNGGAPDDVVALTFSRRWSIMHVIHAVADAFIAVHAWKSCCFHHNLYTGAILGIKNDVSGQT